MSNGLFSYGEGLMDEVYNKYSAKRQTVEMIALGLLGFLVPFVTGAPQLLVGAFVNALLIRSALSLQSYRTLPIIFTPSIGALMQGALFGPMNYFLVFMMPFIWMGNALLVYAFKKKIRNGYNYFLTLAGASLGKAGILYAAAYVLFAANVVPSIFLTAMGMIQLVTAVLGGIIVYAELKAEDITVNKNRIK